jgi:hypothetical protein
MFGGADTWVTWANLSGEYKEYMGGSETQRITITNNTFTASGMIFTKQNGNNGGNETGNGGDDAFTGTWVSYDGTVSTVRLEASNGSFKEYLVANNKEVIRGTYTVSGNTVIVRITQVNTSVFGGADVWVTWANLSGEYKEYTGGSETQRITITGNTLTIDGIPIFIRQNGTGGGDDDGSVGSITFAGGLPSGYWQIFVAPGPIISLEDYYAVMSSVVAVSESSFINGSVVPLFPNATELSFSPNSSYSIIFVNSGIQKYQNNVMFSNGNATINISSMSNLSDLSAGTDVPGAVY